MAKEEVTPILFWPGRGLHCLLLSVLCSRLQSALCDQQLVCCGQEWGRCQKQMLNYKCRMSKDMPTHHQKICLFESYLGTEYLMGSVDKSKSLIRSAKAFSLLSRYAFMFFFYSHFFIKATLFTRQIFYFFYELSKNWKFL